MDHGTDKKTRQLIIIVVCMIIFIIGAAKDAVYWFGTGAGHQSIFKILDIF